MQKKLFSINQCRQANEVGVTVDGRLRLPPEHYFRILFRQEPYPVSAGALTSQPILIATLQDQHGITIAEKAVFFIHSFGIGPLH